MRATARNISSFPSEPEDAGVSSKLQRPSGCSLRTTEDSVSPEDEQRDLDNYLQNLREDADSDKDRSHLEIMERLVAFSKRQLSRISPNLPSESKSTAKHNSHQEVRPSVDVHSGATIDGSKGTDKFKLQRKTRAVTRNEHKSPSVCADPQVKASTAPQHPVKELIINQNDACVSGRHKPLTQTPQRKEYAHHKHHPTSSVYRKQPAVERTDVLYDNESSHLESFNVLPEDIISEDCIVLIVQLSSPGVIRGRAHEKGNRRRPAATESHIYNTLVSWFLSLAGPDPHPNQDRVPFRVAGLQQAWTEEGLALRALAVAHHSCSLGRKDFVAYVCRFLSETSLSETAHWLPKLQDLLDQQGSASSIDLPSSSLNAFISATASKKSVDEAIGLSPGFYWQIVETQGDVCRRRETTQELHTEVSLALGGSDVFRDPLITHYTLQLVLDSGLDVCGLRLLYPPQRFLGHSAGVQRSSDCQPVLALAVRGPRAFSVLKGFTDSSCPLLSQKTYSSSAGPLQSQSQEPCLFHSPGLESQVHKELCLWFAGRLPRGTVENHNQHLNRTIPSGDGVGGSLFSSSTSPAFLCATSTADVLLVVAPAVPARCYGPVLAVCERRGFGLEGLRRRTLKRNTGKVLGLTREQVRVFCSLHTESLDQKGLKPPPQCLVVLLKKENAVHHSLSLPTALMRELRARKLLSCIRLRDDGVQTAEPSLCFHTVPYSSNLSHTFIRSMWTVPDPTRVILSHRRPHTDCDVEQVVILTLRGKDMGHGLGLLHRMLAESPEGGTELLGLKWLPGLTQLQAQELSPYEVGEQLFHSSVETLMSSPSLLCALKRRNAFASLKTLLPYDYPGNLSVLMSPTPEVAFRQAALFFEHWMTG
ncbi:dynein axonemal assembly factor 8 isoform X3 [Betta splendens]|uniref:Dynein axonemal assembly factor 8 isoform X3 n=1 Tax=Betta splendens TaxID=158456 RepID=A0A6P7N5M4_BETSP|nr:dynein axonemal assembly factor 8 isoform X3 [Betta splendens]